MRHDHIEIIRESIDRLSRRVWRFWCYEFTVYVDVYIDQTRPSLRHRNWITKAQYERIGGRGNTLAENGVEVPEDVSEEAVSRFANLIKFGKWSDRK